MPCNKRVPGSGCPAMHGHNRMHAVLGTSEACIATSPGDMPVALAALGAVVRIRSVDGERTVPVTEFHVVPGDRPERDSVLRHGELITAVDVPSLPWARRSHYRKVRDRASYAFAMASAAVALDLDGATVRHARIALGGVGTKPWRSLEAERLLGRRAHGPGGWPPQSDGRGPVLGGDPDGQHRARRDRAEHRRNRPCREYRGR